MKSSVSRTDTTASGRGSPSSSGASAAQKQPSSNGPHLFSIERVPYPTLTFAADGTVTRINAAALALFEADREEEVLGRNIYAVGEPPQWSPDDTAAAVTKVQAGQPVTLSKWGFKTLKGRRRLLDIVAIPLVTESGEIEQILGFARDITEEAAAERNQALLAAIVESTEDAILSISTDARVMSWNSGAERMLGFSAAEAIGHRVVDLYVPPEARDFVEGEIRNDLKTLETNPRFVRRGEFPLQRKDGSRVDAWLVASGISDAAGKVIGMSNILRDMSDRRNAEREQRLLSALVNSSDDAINSVSPDLKIMTWNRGSERLLGFTAEEAMGRNAAELYASPELRPLAELGIRQDMEKLAADPNFVHRLEQQVARKDGSIIDVSIVASGIYDSSGELLGMSNVIRDITERRRQEREQGLLAALVKSSEDGIISVDLDARITSWNAAAEKLFGYSAKEAIGQNIANLVVPPDRRDLAVAGVKREFAAASAGRPLAVRHSEVAALRKGGGTVDVSVWVSGIYDSSGKLLGASTIVRDITEAKRAERHQRELATIVNATQDAIIGLSADSKIASWNRAAEETFGFTAEQAIGRGLDLILPLEEVERAVQGHRRVMDTGESACFELRAKRKTGESYVSQVNVFPIRDSSGKIVSTAGIGRDINALKQIETELRDAHEYTRGLIESSIDAMVTVDQEMRITDSNMQLSNLTQVPRNILLGSPFESYFTDPSVARDAVKKAFSEGFVSNIELVVKTASGREVPISFNASLFYKAGQVSGIFGVARDVTEQRAIERTLRTEREYSRNLVQSSPDAMLVSDGSLKLTDVNERALALTGYTREELLGVKVESLFSDPLGTQSVLEKVLREGPAHDIQLSLLTRDARTIPVSLNASAFGEPNHPPDRIAIAMRDASESKRAQEASALLASIVGASAEAIYSETRDMIVTSWNPAAEALFGYRANEIIGHSAALLVPLDRRGELLDRAQRICKTRKAEQFETVRLRKDGKPLNVAVTTSPMLSPTGEVLGMSITMRDIGAEKHRDIKGAKPPAQQDSAKPA